MKTENLTKTNIIPEIAAREIETVLGCELIEVYTFKLNYVRSLYDVLPDFCPPKNEITDLRENFRYAGMIFKVSHVFFNKKDMTLTVIGRDRWKRTDKKVVYFGEIVGYKLPTTKLPEGYIYGNFNI